MSTREKCELVGADSSVVIKPKEGIAPALASLRPSGYASRRRLKKRLSPKQRRKGSSGKGFFPAFTALTKHGAGFPAFREQAPYF